MIVVRNVFRLKFGKAKDVLALWKEGQEIEKRAGGTGTARAMTDLVGPFYTFVMEEEFPSISEFEREAERVMAIGEWKGWYQKFVPLVESGYREIFTVVE